MVVTIRDERNIVSKEFELLKSYLECDVKTLKTLVEDTCTKYPYLTDITQGIYLLAQENNVQFAYEKDGSPTLSSIRPDQYVDISRFIS